MDNHLSRLSDSSVSVSSKIRQDITQIQSPATSETDQHLPYVQPVITRSERDYDGQKPQGLRNVESAVQKFPPELLSLIFKDCQEWRGSSVKLPKNSWFPWVLSLVCSHWRQVLWTIAEIWSDIQILSHLSQRQQATLPSIIDQIMAQTHGLVSLEVPMLDIDIFTKVMTPCLGRFRSLRLTLSFDLLGIFLNLPLNYFTSLKSLEITVAKTDLIHPPMAHQTDTLKEASRLETFSISYPYQIKRLDPTYALSGLWLPWSQLTAFKCRGAHSIADLHNVLSQCTALVECSVVVRQYHAEEIAEDHPPIILPHLHTLSIAPFSGNADWTTFLEPFVLPSLEVLRCEDWALEAFEALVSRSQCCLKELESFTEASFTDPLDDDSLCNLLRMLPSLVLLCSIPLPADIFNLISNGEILPHITTLNCSVDIDGLDAFLDLMEKYPSGHGIQSAHISLYPGLDDADEVNSRFDSDCERFDAEERNITMEIAY